MKIRAAKMLDLKRIQELNLRLFKREKKLFDGNLNTDWVFAKEGTDYFKESIEDDRAVALVVEEDEKIVGYMVGWLLKRRNPCRRFKQGAELENMYVEKDYRGKGIGTKLVEEFVEWARKKGADNLKIGLYTANKEAYDFYINCGFKDYYRSLELNF